MCRSSQPRQELVANMSEISKLVLKESYNGQHPVFTFMGERLTSIAQSATSFDCFLGYRDPSCYVLLRCVAQSSS